jgi:hypothetical protein
MSARLQSFVIRLCSAAAIALLSACGGGGGGTAASSNLPSTGSGSNTTTTSTSSAAATIALTLQQYTPVQTSSTHRRAAFISPATAQITLALTSVNGAATTGLTTTYAVGANAPNCTSANGIVSCNLTANLPVGTDTLTATTLNASGTSLGSSTIAASVVQNAANDIALSVGGQIASLQLYLSHSSLASGTAGSANVIVVPLDQSGAEIVNPGNYSPAIAITSSSTVNGHVSLITDGSNTGQTAAIASPNDQVVVSYDGVATSGSTNIVASAGTGIMASKTFGITTPGLTATPASSPQYNTIPGYIFTSAGQHGTIAVTGGTAPYTVTSSNTSVATVAGSSGSYTVTAVGYGSSGTTTITVQDSASGLATIPVTFIAPAVAIAIATCGSGATCNATSVYYPVPQGGPTTALASTTITASGGINTYAYYFGSTGTTVSPYATASQSGNQFTITPTGFGNDAIIVSSGNQIAYYGIAAGANVFQQSLPSGIGMLVEQVGKYYSATLPSFVTNVVEETGPTNDSFSFQPSGPTISATPQTSGHGTLRFSNSTSYVDIPRTIFGLTFSTYQGAGASSTLEQTTPGGSPGADEQFTGIGQTDTVSVTGTMSNLVSAVSGNVGIVTVSASGTQVTVTSVGAGTTTITLTDVGNGVTASYPVSVTSTTIPIASGSRIP